MKILTGVMNPIAHDGRVQRASEALSRLGDVTLVCPTGPVLSDVPYEVRAIELPRGLGSRFTEHTSFWWAFVSEARRIRPELIYVHDHYLTLCGALAARLTGAKLVYDAHELSIPERGRRMSWQEWAKYLFDRLGVRTAQLVVATGPERAEMMRAHYDLKQAPLIVRNIAEAETGAPLNRKSGMRLPKKTGEVLFVYEGHVALERGIQDFIAALKFLPAHYRLVIVGGGPHVEAMAEVARDLGVAARVELTGRVSRPEVMSVIRQCDIGLISYSWRGLNNLYCAPNKIFEYAHAGLPIVATAQPPLQSAIETYQIGTLITEGATAAEIAQAMRAALERREFHVGKLPHFLALNRWDTEAERLCNQVARVVDEYDRLR